MSSSGQPCWHKRSAGRAPEVRSAPWLAWPDFVAPALMTWAALFAIAFSFCGKLGALLASIPMPVICGIGGLHLEAGRFELQGIALAGVLGVALNLVLPRRKH